MQKTKISVLGCGWLGLPLAQELVRGGYDVKGSTTTPAKVTLLQSKGITPFLLSFPENKPETGLTDFLDAEILILTIPPSKISTKQNDYEQTLSAIINAIPAQLKYLLFVSSTSVYQELNREMTEPDAVASAEATSLLLRCEFLVQQKPGVQVTTVRFGGLMGGQRHPGKWLAGKTNVPHPEAPVNMIHLVDCVQLLSNIIQQKQWGYTFNACAPAHPSREEFYTQAAQTLQLPPPAFVSSEMPSFKQINSQFITQKLHYSFRFPDPLSCLLSPEF